MFCTMKYINSAETLTESAVKSILPAIKKLKARTSPTIAIMKHICLPPKVHEQTF